MSSLIYLASTAYTGSTLISILMGSHPAIATISELTGVEPTIDANTYPCSCGALLTECSFFKEVARKVRSSGADFSYQDFNTRFYDGHGLAQRLLYRSLRNSSIEALRDRLRARIPAVQRSIGRWSNQNSAIIRAVLEASGKSAFLDASKDPCRIPFLSTMHDGPIFVIHVTRDVRGYVNSARKNQGVDARRASRSWLRAHRDIVRFSDAQSLKYKRIQYEALCRDTSATLKDIFSFCELDTQVDVDFAPAKLHLIGNRMRLKSDLRVHLDESWRTDLDAKEQAIAWNIAGDLMTSFGYMR